MALPAGVATVGDLLDHLTMRAPEYREAFKESARLRCAVNQIHCDFAQPIKEDDEIAFFPPVTGG